jgi:transcriptional regulator with XRE-family HTH domain
MGVKRHNPVAAAFRRYMLRHKLTVAEVARAAKKDPSTITKWLNGSRDPRCSQIAEIFEACDLLTTVVKSIDDK